MRLSLVAPLFFSLGLIRPVWTSLLVYPEDSEGSGYDLDGSGSGSGDGSKQGETEIVNNHHNNNNSRAEGTKNTLNGFSGNTFGDTKAFAIDYDSEYVFVANSKSYLENKEVITVVIAGGVTGLALAAIVAGILIYKWQKKDEEDGYILGQEKVSDNDHQKPDRDVVFV